MKSQKRAVRDAQIEAIRMAAGGVGQPSNAINAVLARALQDHWRPNIVRALQQQLKNAKAWEAKQGRSTSSTPAGAQLTPTTVDYDAYLNGPPQ